MTLEILLSGFQNNWADPGIYERKNLLQFRIAGKFGGENVWRIYSFQVFGAKSMANE